MFNYSFWADEAYIAGIAQQFNNESYSLIQSFQALNYQKLYIIIISIFLKLFGITEFTARIPSIIFFVLGIIVIFKLTSKISNKYGGFVATFLYTLSHLNLAYATQVKPNLIIEVLMLTIILIITNRKINHFFVIILLISATFLHSIGIFLWIIYISYLFLNYKNLNKRYRNLFVIVIPIFSVLFVYVSYLFFKSSLLFKYNHIYQFIKLFFYKYFFITLIASLGFYVTFKKKPTLSIPIAIYVFLLSIATTFQHYAFNIRYVLSIFGLMFMYFGISIAYIGEYFFPKKKWLIPLIVILLIYTTGYKIVRYPQAYYNPNIDKYGDVQIANYKDFYAKLKTLYPNYKELTIFNDTLDAEYWYMGRYSDAYFMKFVDKPYLHPVSKKMIYGSLSDFKKQMAKHKKGLLIMEDWESFLPEDIKQYAKKNLKLVYRIESLKEAPNDPWPLALYSWGDL